MKVKLFYLLNMCLFISSTIVFSQTQQFPGDVKIDGSTGIGSNPRTDSKLYLYRSNTSAAGTLYGLFATQTSTSSGLIGAYFVNSNSNSSSTGGVYGLYSTNTKYSSGPLYGGYFNNSNYNTTTYNPIYGVYSSNYTASPNSTVYGIYSFISGNTTAKRWAGYFSGGDMYVSGNVGIGTSTPQAKLDVNGTMRTSVHSSNQVINAMNIDVQGFGTWGNAENSSFLKIMDVGGNRTAFIVKGDGNVGIDIANPTVKLDVNGIVRAHEVRVCLDQGCDYVFADDYNLMSINDVADFVKTNRHLPDVAPAAEMEAEGINVSEMSALLLRKIEELTLYVIEMKQENEALRQEMELLKQR